MNIVPLNIEVDDSALRLAREILAGVESGELVELVAICTAPGGSYTTRTSALKNNSSAIGKLFSCTVDIVRASEVGEDEK